MKKLIGKLLFPFRVTLRVLMPFIGILMLPIKIVRVVTKFTIGIAIFTVIFGGEPLGQTLYGLWPFILIYILSEVLIAIPYVVLEMTSPNK